MHSPSDNPFTLDTSSLPIPEWGKRTLRSLNGYVSNYLGFSQLADLYTRNRGETNIETVIDNVFRELNITYEISYGGLEHVPQKGPVIVVANHPFGGVEGLVVAKALMSIRPDVKLWANYLLERIPELRDLFIFLDPFGGEEAARKNIVPLRQTLEWLKNGGLLSTFPSGTVSHLQLGKLEISDPDWNPLLARIIRKTQATIVPIYFHGINSALFQAAGLIHPRLRTALIPREFLNKQNKPILFRVGKPISPDRLTSFSDDQEMLSYLRFRTYLLRTKVSGEKKKFSSKFLEKKKDQKQKPIIPPIDGALMEQEINALPQEQLLVESRDCAAFYASAHQIPLTLQEIGRLREVSFRQVQEGTGKSLDIDRFDNYYLHLFTWDRKARQIVGGYRMGRTDRITERYGMRGLYTSTLFQYKEELLSQLGPSLELGRSFVRAEYQKNYSSLLLLWKGIGRYVARNKQYKNLFGTVSINSDYDSMSKELIVSFLKASNLHPELTKLVRPRNPMPSKRFSHMDPKMISVVVKDIHEVSELIAEIEAREHSVPVLLRHYLKLGGKLLGFNIDPDFGNVLDGLILVDLTETDHKLCELYVGKDNIDSFLAYHDKERSYRRTGTV